MAVRNKIQEPQSLAEQKTAGEVLRQIRLIVENSHDAIIGATLDGVITSWNGGAVKMFGYSPDEVIGQPMTALFTAERKTELSGLLQLVARGEVIPDYDSVWVRKDTTFADVGFSISPVLTPEGQMIGASIVGRDITERKKSERHVKELNEIRNKFITIISHQLRTPLTAVNWNLESLLNGDFGKLEETQRRFLQVTHHSSLELSNRIHRLLTAMDVEEGRIRYETGEVSLHNLCAGVINEYLPTCELKGLTCTYTAPTVDLMPIQGDGDKLRTIITTLVENAVGYTKQGGKISASLQSKNGVIRFEVSDTGVGIPSAEQHFIFTRFFRASNASIMQPDAFGLSLYVAKHFITQHKGTIGFTSTEGKGSTFWFEVPMHG